MTTTAEPPFRASRYTTGAILLHWLIALLIVVQLVGGYVMTDVLRQGSATQFDVYQLHKSFGITVLLLTIARILWRAFNPPPPEPAAVGRLEAVLARIVHIAFYGLLLVIPLTGWFVITVAPVQIETVLFFADWLPFPHLPGFDGLTVGARDALAETGEAVHAVLAYSMLALLGLHVAGALKHQITHGGFVQRMLTGGRGDGPRRAYGHVATVLVTFLIFGGLVGSATLSRQSAAPPLGATADPTEVAAPASPEAAPPEPEAAASPAEAAGGAGDTAVSAAPPMETAAAPSPEAGTPGPGEGATSAAPLEAAVVEAAPPAEGASETPATAQAVPWQVNKEESALTYSLTYSGAEVDGGFGKWDASIVFAPDDLANSSIDVTIDTTSATIRSSEISLQNLDGADGFDNRSYGTARFTSDTLRADGDDYVADGVLTIRGQDVPQSLRFSLQSEGDRARAEGALVLDRLDYGVGANSDRKGEWLGLEVTVNVVVVATRQPAGAAPAESGQQSAATIPGGNDGTAAADDAAGEETTPAATGEATRAPAAAERPASPAGAAPRWTVLPQESRVTYVFGFDNGSVSGELPGVNATVRFDENNLGGSSIRARIDLDTVTVSQGGVSASQIKGADGLDVAGSRFASFEADTIEAGADGGFVAHGTLDVRGVRREITLPFTLERRDDGLVLARGTVGLDRAGFGFAEQSSRGGPSFGPTVDVTVEIVARPPE